MSLFERINEGDRPSHLQLGRFATGELDDVEAAEVQAWLDANDSDHFAQLDASSSLVPGFDATALRARAAELEDDTQVLRATEVRPANNTAWYAAGLLVLAAVFFGMFLAQPTSEPGSGEHDAPGYQLRAPADLHLYSLDAESKLAPYDGQTVGEGDVLGFKVTRGTHRSVVVLSVDGNGTVSVFYPAAGNDPMPLTEDMVPMPDSVTLDGAPGPEIFLAVFDKTVAEARTDVRHSFQSGGHEGLRSWADDTAHVVAAEVQRR